MSKDTSNRVVSVTHSERTGPFGGKYQETHVVKDNGTVGEFSHNRNCGGVTRLNESERTAVAIKDADRKDGIKH